jgi:polyadenylate-binding protein
MPNSTGRGGTAGRGSRGGRGSRNGRNTGGRGPRFNTTSFGQPFAARMPASQDARSAQVLQGALLGRNGITRTPLASIGADSSMTTQLQTMDEAAQKQHVGELLFPKIQGMLQQRYAADSAEKLASKVTGMFLEMDTSGLLYLLDTDDECNEKINEALDVLRAHAAMPEGCM